MEGCKEILHGVSDSADIKRSNGWFMGRAGFIRILIFAAVALFGGFARMGSVYAAEEQVPETDGEIWNRGVDLYREGNMTNALAVLKPLILSKTHGARASELVGAIEFAQGLKRDGDGAAEPLRALESAAVDFQTALRSNPDDPRMNRNFTRAADRLPELREQAHVEKVMKELGQQDPGGLLGAGVKDARAMMKEFPVALTNEARVAVAKCEAMAKRAARLNDTWIAVKAGVAQSVTNEQQAMTIMAQVEEARTATETAAKALSDLDPTAQDALAQAETSLTRFWKLAILPPGACDEAILAQTNALIAAEAVNGRDWQHESLDFTRAFRAKFPMWAQAYEQQAQSDTNKPPFTKEAQAEISALATEVEKLQIELCGEEMKLTHSKPERKGGGKAADHAAKEFQALKKLHRIRELLPKDKNGGGGQSQPNQNQQNQDQNKDQNQDQNQNQDQQNQDQNKDQNQDQDKNQGQDQQNQDQEQNKEDEQKKEEQQAAAEEQKDDRQVEDMLRKAQERSDQHEADKKARMRKAPLPANERDW